MKNLYSHFKKAPRYTIKWKNYFPIYEKLLKKFQNKRITLVEIGLGDGGSLHMWKSFLGKKSRIIGIELNPNAKKLEKDGFEIFIGDQARSDFWKNFYKKVGKVDVIIDDGGHRNVQQITTLVESVKYINKGGLIAIEDTHSNFMKKKGYGNPSKYSLINFSMSVIENIHRRNPMLNKKMNFFSKYIYSIEFFDSIVVFNINKNKCVTAIDLENNSSLKENFIDYKYRGNSVEVNKKSYIMNFLNKNFSKRSFFFKILDNLKIKKYINFSKN